MGRKSITFWPAAAPMPAMEEPALPVDATTMVSMPFSFANAETNTEALSFNELVGLAPSSLI